jgi:hypothetical protein
MLYTYKEPNQKEENLIFVMLEDRGSRALYQELSVYLSDKTIKPCEAVFKSDMIEFTDRVQVRNDMLYINGKLIGHIDENKQRKYWEFIINNTKGTL